VSLCANSFCAVAQAQETPFFEIDVIFPRNETYTPSDDFPIAIAIQNITAVDLLGDDWFAAWEIMPYSDGRIPSGNLYDNGEWEQPSAGDVKNGTYIFVANSNVTAWIGRKFRNERYMLNWIIVAPKYRKRCGILYNVVLGKLMFSVEGPWEKEGLDWPDAGLGTPPDVMQVPECPILGSVVELRGNVSDPTCPSTVDKDTGRPGNPCNVVVDEVTKSSIVSEAASLATPPPTETATPSAAPDDDSAAHGTLVPGFAVLAAAGMFGMALF